MKESIGQAAQLLGLIVVGWGFFIGLTQGAIMSEVVLMFCGAAIFWVGRQLGGCSGD